MLTGAVSFVALLVVAMLVGMGIGVTGLTVLDWFLDKGE